MGVITTSLVVEFDPGDGEGVLKAEIDGRVDGYNNGITNFIPGDSPAFLRYKSGNVDIDSQVSSAGSISSLGSGSITIDEYITFTNTREGSPGYPISSNFTYKWVGTSWGLVTATENKVTTAVNAIGVLKVSYTSRFDAFRLTSVPLVLDGETTFPVVIFISGVVV